jgi:hypothetical protein
MKLRLARKILKDCHARGKHQIDPRQRRDTVLRALSRTRVQCTVVTIAEGAFQRTKDMLEAWQEDAYRSAGIGAMLPCQPQREGSE